MSVERIRLPQTPRIRRPWPNSDGALRPRRAEPSRVFLADYPDHRLAPSAQFFLADVYEQELRLDEAVEVFLRIPELYPTDDRVPVALYRAGAIFALQENVQEAVRYLETVVNTYPDSDAADLAQELLQEIR